MDEHTDVRPEALFLAALAQDLFLSAACAAAKHEQCWLVDPFSGRTCCCPECNHVDLVGAPPRALMPLWHLAEEGRRKDGYTYHGDEPLGVRTDLYEVISRALELHIHERRRPRVAYDAAVRAALVFAPRSGA